jgi:hypothetical protein
MPPYIQSHSRIAAPNSTLITIKQPPHCPPHLYLIISISLLSQQCNRILKDRFPPRSLTILRCLKVVTTSLDALTTTCPILKEFSPQHGGGHNPLCFVTTCDDGAFNGGGGVIYATPNKFSCLICRYKATLTYFFSTL